MTDGSPGSSSPKPTWNHVKDAGSWTIEVGAPDSYSTETLRQFTFRMIGGFVAAFGQLARVVGVQFDRIVVDADGTIVEVHEGQVRQLESGSRATVIEQLQSFLDNNATSYVSDVFLACDLRILAPASDRGSDQMWVPRAGEFFVGYRLETRNDGKLVPADCSVRFETSIDVWLRETIDTATWQPRRNDAWAELNRPRLEAALREWERVVGKPIAEWSSSLFADRIFRYGFLDGG